MFTNVNLVECPQVWLFHVWHNTRCVHSTRGITWVMSIPHYGKHGASKHVTRIVLSVSCYHAFPRMEKWSYNWALLYVVLLMKAIGANLSIPAYGYHLASNGFAEYDVWLIGAMATIQTLSDVEQLVKHVTDKGVTLQYILYSDLHPQSRWKSRDSHRK